MKMALVPVLVALGFGSAAGGERFACKRNALTSVERERHAELSQALLGAVDEQKELSNGYAFRMPPAQLLAVAEWVSLERKCCPFFTFHIELTRDEGPLWLHVTGSKGVKAFLREEFGLSAR